MTADLKYFDESLVRKDWSVCTVLIDAENQVEEMIERAATLGLVVGEVPVGSLLKIFNKKLKLFFQLHKFGRSQVMMLKSTNKRLSFNG